MKPILLFTSVGFGFASFLVAFTLGSALTATTGIPLAGGVLNGVLTAMVLTIGLLSTRFFGSATLMWIVFATCASLTTTLGPPGLYKLAIGAIAGFIWDSLYSVANRRPWGLYIGALLGSASIMVTLIFALSYGFGKNAAEALENYQGALAALMTINLLVTFIGVYVGNLAYKNRLSKLPAFENLRRYAE